MACTTPTFENLTVPSNFSLNRFLGRWYEVKWLPGESHNESDIWRDFSQEFQLENNVSQRLIVAGKARLPNQAQCFSVGPWSILANNSAKMILETQTINSNTTLNWPYYVVKIDYDHYALVYGCMSQNYTSNDACEEPILWLFSRTKSLSTDYSNPLDNYIENTLCINLTKLEITPQSETSCYSSSSLKNYSMNKIIIFNLLILYSFLIRK
ncbi:unnamed protein product [Rotaria magnacalcarata]|uniref:Apolipoprotein D n=2 Tax=Rotaria magnacalcarata TaxID=392030 RepID=A0A816FNR3_9BILA|nr:unnamed protein product [Rotaria magnacalcarata]CAF1664005.1 unnamed protein product [Rotaria magnacalcarata]CAF2052365.1 unnamed protein product [Rotaria magnacalcarata]CAF2072418.1 unnamed protein product [Rotaria magnacalcarata]CAF2146459.1 unnamed protein product [Rotaria magnacalcarata]